jgi:light-regulated signal transduction histidine kinase (bacteriophytochrome)
VELVEDALRMNLAAFDRHHIELVREFDEHLPKLCVDRHKVLQILINLLRNAKHAMEETGEQGRRMVIRLSQTSPDWVKIVVSDNGIGIPPENLTRIFNHGFTTKKDGHGFGLHSGANAPRKWADDSPATATARARVPNLLWNCPPPPPDTIRNKPKSDEMHECKRPDA